MPKVTNFFIFVQFIRENLCAEMFSQNLGAEGNEDNSGSDFKPTGRKAPKAAAQLIAKRCADKTGQADNDRGRPNRRIDKV